MPSADEMKESPPELGVWLVQDVQHDLIARGRVRDHIRQQLLPPLEPLRRLGLCAWVCIKLVVQQHIKPICSEIAHLQQALHLMHAD